MKLSFLSAFLVITLVHAKRIGEAENQTKEETFASGYRKLVSLTEKGNNGSPASAYPLGICEGDCDSDADCEPGLKCFQRSDSRPIDGCSGTGRSGIDYCYRPSSSGSSSSSLTILGNDGDDIFPLGKCQGDCDSDSDCRSGLKCFQRDDSRSVPGCSGSGESGRDYCYDPSDDSGGGSSGGGFRLKLYWQEGYFWQEETFERKWCLECGGSGSSCSIHTCDGDNTKFEFVKQSRGYQIKVVGNDRCMENTDGSDVRIRPCSSSESRQQWTGSFSSSKFEISPVNKPDRCLTQPHHPRSGETVSAFSCSTARRDTTSYWNKY